MLADTVQTAAISITEAAAQAVTDIMKQRNLTGYALRVYLSGGGCSGYQVALALEGKIREKDLSYEFNGVKLVVDEISINYLRGATIDYVDNPEESGFKIENPNPLPACGCGSSSNPGENASDCGSSADCNCS